jgi:hypothetical protein
MRVTHLPSLPSGKVREPVAPLHRWHHIKWRLTILLLEWVRSGELDHPIETPNTSLAAERVELVPVESFVIERKPAKLPCFMLPTFDRNKDFCGRGDILEELDRYLLPPRNGEDGGQPDEMKHVALCGTGGLGKTEIALQYAFTRKDRFDAIFWIRADDIEKIEADFSQITVALGLENEDDLRNSVVSRELAKGWLANPTKEQHTQQEATWLIIFDNADDPDILADYSQMLGSGSILVTSRHPLAKELFSPSTHGIDLLPLSAEDGANLLKSLTHQARNRKDASLSLQIAQRLGGLPLAITQMAGIIRNQFMNYSEFLEIYDDDAEHGSLHQQEAAPRRKSARGSLASVWAFDKLPDNAKFILEILAFLDPDCIQEFIFLEHFQDLASTPRFPKTRYTFRAARGKLLESSLIRQNDDTGHWWIHRVLQDAVRASLCRTPEILLSRFKLATKAVFMAWPAATAAKLHAIDNWDRCRAIYPHVIFLRDLSQRYEDLKEAEDLIDFAALLNRAAW